ncbi:16S rRNA (cytidine(1402)-2'-O)-methyltransferase [bacterium]|nr:16S rRNA (cytidine(1402)-2'-O)-methyltransferase [bacterium]
MTSKVSKNIKKNILKSGFYVVATPIGNMEDISFRAVDTLKNADIIACEDTRVSKTLLFKYGIETPTVSIHNYNESEKINWVKEKIDEGLSIALISDAGMPLISDPGYKIVSSLREAGYYITVIPGATSTISALVLSGMPTDRFMFIGFVPTKNQERISFFDEIKGENASVIFFETANRLIDTLNVLDNIFGNRQIAIVREISKIYEEVKVASAGELLNYFKQNGIKGEIVGVISPNKEKENVDMGKVKSSLCQLLQYMPLKEASDFIAKIFDISKKDVYNLGIELKNK